jgi:hypothetical protein
MTYESIKTSESPRVLMFSQRNIHDTLHYRCALREFEDLICEIDQVEMLAPTPKNIYKHSSRLALKLAAEYAVSFNPGIPKKNVGKEYDMFFAFCMFPKELLNVESVKGWEECSKVSVCWIDEIWLSDLYWCRYYLDILAKFDVVMITLSSSVDAVSNKIGKGVSFLPLGIDSLLFCPYPNKPERSVDVYSLGRRSEITHNKLLELSKLNKYFYIFDTMDAEKVIDPVQHRVYVSNLAKRAKYFIVNPGKVDIPNETTIQSEFGARYFEGCAAGTIMIGEHPKAPSFKEIFHWPNAVIEFPFDGDHIEELIQDLEHNSQVYEPVRRENVIQSLTKHDWLHRWSYILENAGLSPCDGLLEREDRLKKVSESI